MAEEIAESAVTRLDEGEIEASIEQVDVAMDSLAEIGEAVEERRSVSRKSPPSSKNRRWRFGISTTQWR
ncbi:hypothetical protein ACFFQF_02900 [Haladaptatus pallidirubidus]|uniref:hypothetical protein n=1 Tax=Haladaptatus pallidirubidus TaxID=1008152 RepID=UPI001D1277F3|nr:hypothetical protein [Haladaptatus pallidirubidus]